jgi:hypothetical protein
MLCDNRQKGSEPPGGQTEKANRANIFTPGFFCLLKQRCKNKNYFSILKTVLLNYEKF